MLEARIRNVWLSRCLTIGLLAMSAALSSCSSQKPAPTLVADPDAATTGSSSIPWNKPANWEGRGNLPPGAGVSPNQPFGGIGGTGGY